MNKQAINNKASISSGQFSIYFYSLSINYEMKFVNLKQDIGKAKLICISFNFYIGFYHINLYIWLIHALIVKSSNLSMINARISARLITRLTIGKNASIEISIDQHYCGE